MTQAGYNPSLNTELDWVRFLTADTKTPDAILQDEEIKALLKEEPNKYYAAAEAISSIRLKLSGPDETRLAGGTFPWNSTAESVDRRIDELKARGAEDLTPKPSAFRVL